jgi:hypothetical protein
MCAVTNAKGITLLAATSADGKDKGLLVTDYKAKVREIALEVTGVADGPAEIWVHDHTRNLEKISGRVEKGKLLLEKADPHSAAFFVSFPAQP